MSEQMTQLGAPARPVAAGAYMMRETIVSVVVNIVIAALFTWLLYPARPFHLVGAGGLLIDLVPATILPVLGMTLGLTFVTRARTRAGKVARLLGPSRFPAGLGLRTLVIVVLGGVAPGVLGWVLVVSFWSPDMSDALLVSIRLLHGALVGALAAPVILLAALRD